MSRKFALLDFILSLTGLALVVIALLTLGPAVETRFFPVYSKFEIYSIEETPTGGSEVVFRYHKYRSCAPSGFMWFIGEPGGAFRQLNIISERPNGTTVNRAVGENTSVPYKVDVAPDVLAKQGFASIYSNCHPFWVTRSIIYP